MEQLSTGNLNLLLAALKKRQDLSLKTIDCLAKLDSGRSALVPKLIFQSSFLMLQHHKVEQLARGLSGPLSKEDKLLALRFSVRCRQMIEAVQVKLRQYQVPALVKQLQRLIQLFDKQFAQGQFYKCYTLLLAYSKEKLSLLANKLRSHQDGTHQLQEFKLALDQVVVQPSAYLLPLVKSERKESNSSRQRPQVRKRCISQALKNKKQADRILIAKKLSKIYAPIVQDKASFVAEMNYYLRPENSKQLFEELLQRNKTTKSTIEAHASREIGNKISDSINNYKPVTLTIEPEVPTKSRARRLPAISNKSNLLSAQRDRVFYDPFSQPFLKELPKKERSAQLDLPKSKRRAHQRPAGIDLNAHNFNVFVRGKQVYLKEASYRF